MKKNSIVIIVALVVLILGTDVLGQNRKRPEVSQLAYIQKNRPTIYLTFERSGMVKEGLNNKKSERIWLRLNNNSRWGVRIEASGGNKALEDARLYYDMIDVKENLIVQHGCHVCSIVILGSGKSILFSVPSEDFSEESALRIKFSYAWENDLDVIAGLEPKHYVFFYSNNLPQN